MSLRKKIAWCLAPLTMWYGVVVGVRNLLFNIGVLKQKSSPMTTIGVGNIACGGTGKTPHVEYVLRLLGEEYRTAVLSRGYRRKSRGFQVNDGTMDPAERVRLLGDEPAMMAEKFAGVTVAVCEKRVEGLRELHQQEEAPEVVVLDDVFQHRQVKPDLNILLTEYRKPYYRDHVLPFGDLRESRRGHRRADIIVVTKCPEKLNPIERRNMTAQLKPGRHQKVFFSYLKYGELRRMADGAAGGWDNGKTHSALVVTGIAHPEPMVQYMKRFGKVRHLAFGDHHSFTESDLAKIRQAYEELPEGGVVVTTEKDAARLTEPHCREALQGIPLYVLPIEVVFHENKEESFDEVVLYRVKEGVRWKRGLSV